MAGQEKWYFSRDQLINSPSRKCGLDADKELAYRQQAANLIQDMGQRLHVSQLCINTAIVYMHRFYAFHSFTQFHRNAMAAAALFLAAKMEEQPRKLEHVIKVAHICLHRGDSQQALDVRSDHYQEQAQDLVFNENVLLQTLGFDVAIDHPHTHVVKTCSLIRASKDLAQTSYFMASNSLHLTTMCLQYRPTVVACFCIHLASKWSNWEIPQSNEGKHWFNYVDRSVTAELLEHLTSEFLHIFDRCPSRLKKKIMSISNSQGTGSPQQQSGQGSSAVASSPFDKEPRKIPPEELEKVELDKRQQALFGPGTSGGPSKVDYREYRERQAALRRAPPPAAPPPGQRQPQPPAAPPAAPPVAPPVAPAAAAPPATPPGPPLPRWARLPGAAVPSSNGVRAPPRHQQQRHHGRVDGRHSQALPSEQRPRSSQPPPAAAPVGPPASHPPAPPPPAPHQPPRAPAQPTHPPPHRPPSLFSPEPLPRKPARPATVLPREPPLPAPLSPFHSPPNPEPKASQEVVVQIKKEEPVVVESHPSLPPAVPNHAPAVERQERMQPVAVIPDNLETDPNLVSSLLKEAIPHRSEKKKKKEKHKHKDRDKRDEKKKHKKNKDKRRDSESGSSQAPAQPVVSNSSSSSTPIKITIPREAIVNSVPMSAPPTHESLPTRLKIKIPKERLRQEPPQPAAPPVAPPPPALKIKIPKEVVEGASRKRPLPPQTGEGPPSKRSQPPVSSKGSGGPVLGNGQSHGYQK